MPESVRTGVLLAPYTTLNIGGPAEYFVEVATPEALRTAAMWAQREGLPVTAIGHGSNVLISEEGIRGLVIKVDILGTVIAGTDAVTYVTVGAGEPLDACIKSLVAENIWGLENLSGIPGTVGATPIQNVGAYGVEVQDVIASVVAYDRLRDTFVIFTNDACKFAYRNSFFKTDREKRYLIVWVTFALSKKRNPQCSYHDLRTRFGDREPTLAAIRDAVLEIRSGKFPDWNRVGTAGSFFKNPIVSEATFARLKQSYPELPGFPLEEGGVKISLGYVLDKVLGLKGYTKGNVGLYEKQALVLVSHGGATSAEIAAFAETVAQRVREELGITIEWEVTQCA